MNESQIKNSVSRHRGLVKRWGAFFLFLSFNLVAFTNCARGFFTTIDGTGNFTAASLADEAFTCNPNTPPITDSVLRLTGRQFQNTLYALLQTGINTSVDATNLQNFYSSANTQNIITGFPAEGFYAKGNAMVYDTEDQRITTVFFNSEFQLTFAAAEWLIGDANRLTYFVRQFANSAACNNVAITNTGTPQACYDAFIKGFGLMVLRRPVTTVNNSIDASSSNPAADNDLAYYEGIYTDATNGGFDSLITAMIAAPDSLFLAQFKGHLATNSTTQVTLTNYEIASKLSYYFTDSPPDATLLNAAAANFSGSGNTIQDQATRLFSDIRTRGRFEDFYTQWIRPDAIPPLTTSSNSPAGTDLVALRTNAIQEMIDLTEYYTFDAPNGKASDIATSNVSFAKTSDLASLYGVDLWPGKTTNGTIDSTTLVRFPASAPRAGLFTRAGYEFSGARDTNPIIRGARIRKDYFCENLNPPAAFNLSTSIPINGPPTVRNIVVANTQVPGSNCASCHTNLINPLGFGLENYDSFGRYRSQEQVYDPSTGAVTQSVAVDASTEAFSTSNDTATTNDGIAFSQHLGSSIEYNSCFVRHYFRFSQARTEDSTADGCKLNGMMSALVGGSNPSLQAMIKSVPTAPDFQKRTISP